MGNSNEVGGRLSDVGVGHLLGPPDNAVDRFVGQFLCFGTAPAGQNDDKVTANLLVFLAGLLAVRVQPVRNSAEGLFG